VFVHDWADKAVASMKNISDNIIHNKEASSKCDDSKDHDGYDVNSELKDKTLSHCEAMSLVKKNVQELLRDPLLSGIAEDISLEELQDIVHLEQGKAFTLYLRRYDDSILC